MSRKRKTQQADPSAYPGPTIRRRALDRLNETLAGRVVCAQCGATAMTEEMRGCTAGILDACDGFVAIELAIYPDGKTVRGIATDEQITRVRSIIKGAP